MEISLDALHGQILGRGLLGPFQVVGAKRDISLLESAGMLELLTGGVVRNTPDGHVAACASASGEDLEAIFLLSHSSPDWEGAPSGMVAAFLRARRHDPD